jgi:hypothetical protein
MSGISRARKASQNRRPDEVDLPSHRPTVCTDEVDLGTCRFARPPTWRYVTGYTLKRNA